MKPKIKQPHEQAPSTLTSFEKRVWDRTVSDPDFPGIDRLTSRRELLAYCRFAETVRENELHRINEQSRLGDSWQEDGAPIRELVDESRQELAEMKHRIFARASSKVAPQNH
jgi:hypothetical protein